MDYSEDQLQMVAISSDGLFFRDNQSVSGKSSTSSTTFQTIFEPIAQSQKEQSVKKSTISTEENDKNSLHPEKMGSTGKSAKISVENVAIYLTLKGQNQVF